VDDAKVWEFMFEWLVMWWWRMYFEWGPTTLLFLAFLYSSSLQFLISYGQNNETMHFQFQSDQVTSLDILRWPQNYFSCQLQPFYIMQIKRMNNRSMQERSRKNSRVNVWSDHRCKFSEESLSAEVGLCLFCIGPNVRHVVITELKFSRGWLELQERVQDIRKQGSIDFKHL
jgi:hypothetical protein